MIHNHNVLFSLCGCLYMLMCVYAPVCMHVCMHVCVSTCWYVCTCVCVCVCTCVCAPVCACVYACWCTCMLMCVCAYAYVHGEARSQCWLSSFIFPTIFLRQSFTKAGAHRLSYTDWPMASGVLLPLPP